jgi:alkylation response protein AidB-like acyl-CoA dehydrogenase
VEFTWKPEHAAFRRKIRDFLAASLPPDWDRLSQLDNSSEEVHRFSRTFCPALAREGLLIPHWPVEYGGGGKDAWHHWILNEEMWAAGEPRSYQYMSINWVGPAIIKFGTAEQKAEHLPRITGGTVSYCQGFSEPNAGSDLAALQCRAEHTGSGYRVNGQKIWTSNAGFADYCILLVRTGGPGRNGISVLIAPMKTPGMTVRRIPSLQGEHAVNEVFFENVDVPHGALLGEKDKGWSVIGQILHNERIGAPRYALSWRALRRAVARLKDNGSWEREEVQLRAARCEAQLRSAQLQAYRVIDGRVKGRPADAETNVARYAAAVADRAVCEFLGDFVPEALFFTEDPVIAAGYKRTATTGIAAGAAEIQLNLIARTLLGLPSR